MRPGQAALLGLAWLHGGASLRLQADQELAIGSAPVVLVGLGKRPTGLVKQLLQHLGVHMCGWTPDGSHDAADGTNTREDFYSKKPTRFIAEFLRASGGEASQIFRYQEQPAFWDAVKEQNAAAKQSRECVKYERKNHKLPKSNYSWGYKNVDHIHLLPVVDETFARKEHIVAVVRDPRLTCAGENKEEFAKWQDLVNNPQNSSGFTLTGEAACYRYWASVWKSLLKQYGEEKRFRVVRVEDLVTPKPSPDNRALGCLLQHSGASPDEEDRRTHLRPLHALVDTYTGRALSPEARSQVEGSARSADGLLHEVMAELGYSTDTVGLTTPKSPAVCRP